MSCGKCLTILFSVLVLLKGLAGLLLGILGLTVSIIPALLLVTVTIGFTIGLAVVANSTTLNTDALLLGVSFIYVAIGIGAVGLFVGIWGIVAAAKKHRCMLTTGAVILFLLLAAEVVITAFTGVGYAALSSQLTKAEFDKTEGGTKGSYSGAFLNNAQQYFGCCGIDGAADYGINPLDIPETCCIGYPNGEYDLAKCRLKQEGYIHAKGCGEFKGQIPSNFWIPLGVLIGVSAITLFTFIITIAFCCTLRKDEYA